MTILSVFRSHLPNSQYAFKNGKMAHFIKLGDKPAEFLTAVKEEIEQLKAEVGFGHPHIYIPANEAEQTVDTEYDPMAKLKADMRAQILAELGQVPTSGASTSGVAPVLGGMANSSTIQGATAENVKPVPVATIDGVVPQMPIVIDSATGKDVNAESPAAQQSAALNTSATGEVTGVEDLNKPGTDTQVKLSMTDKLAALKGTKAADTLKDADKDADKKTDTKSGE